MGLGCKIDEMSDSIRFHQMTDQLAVIDISLNKNMVWIVLYIIQVMDIPSVSQQVQIDNLILGIFF